MNKSILTIGTMLSLFAFSGCVTQQPKIKEDFTVKYVEQPAKKIKVNALNTIVPKRSEEVIMRGVMMPYEANGVMHDSSFTYLVVKEAGWITASSTKIRAKKRKVLGSINGI